MHMKKLNVLTPILISALILSTACSHLSVGRDNVTSPNTEDPHITVLSTENTSASSPMSLDTAVCSPASDVSLESEPLTSADTGSLSVESATLVSPLTEAETSETSAETSETSAETSKSTAGTTATSATVITTETKKTEAATTESEQTEKTSGVSAESTVAAPEVVDEDTETVPEEETVTEVRTETNDGTETIEDTEVAKSDKTPSTPEYDKTSAPGTKTEGNSDAVVDYSNSSDGYIMVKFKASTSKRIKALVEGPSSTQYQYDIEAGEWVSLPLSDGDGTYKIGVYENVSGNSYAQILATSIRVSLDDEFGPFLHSNQYIDFESAPDTVSKAADLCEDASDTLEKVAEIYDYVVGNISYDYDKAANVQGGYVPDLDDVLSEGSGICLDYAGLMTGMLRSQCIPCKLVVGYAGTAYHAWISVWTEEKGWINDIIHFDGEKWERMDPTFASTGQQSKQTMKYIGDGKNYSARFYY